MTRTNMGSINYRTEVESMVQYRASCLWVRFWVSMYDAGNAGALAAATTVLADVPSLAGVAVRSRRRPRVVDHARRAGGGTRPRTAAGRGRSQLLGLGVAVQRGA